ncbi:MAG: hypothetical protein MI745_15790 [Pseudomonadales bacterium]|nr:hypothetical protein [Pseudomonadales bacterium]
MSSLSLAPKEEQIQMRGVAGGYGTYDDLLQVPPARERQREWSFTQPGGLGRASLSLILFNGRYLEWREVRGGRQQSRELNLAFVSPRPRRLRQIAWLPVGMAALALLAGLAASLLQQGWVAAGCFGVGVVATACAVMASRDRWVFFSEHGRIVLFELYHRRRDRERLEKVLKRIASRCQKARQNLPGGKADLAAEVAEHRRLMMAGCISEAMYQQAKNRIFSRYQP